MVSRSTTTMRKLSSQRGGLLEAAGHRSYFTIVSNVIVKIVLYMDYRQLN